MKIKQSPLVRAGLVTLAGAPEGFDALILADWVARRPAGSVWVHVARDDARMARLEEALSFFADGVEVVCLPAWDCLPYDRVSPVPAVSARRIEALARLAEGGGRKPLLLLTTVSAILQRVPRREMMAAASLTLTVGQAYERDTLRAYFTRQGYQRVEQVMEAGEYALRGDIIDMFAPGMSAPARLDFFGDDLETIRRFDPTTQRSTGTQQQVVLRPVGEVTLDGEAISRFRSGYREAFGAVTGDDPLYEAISEGRKFGGMEHWLPLFHDGVDTVFAYVPDAPITLDHNIDEALTARLETIEEYYQARQSIDAGKTLGAAVYRPLAPATLYLDRTEWDRLCAPHPLGVFSPYAPPEDRADTVDLGARPGRDFGDLRAQPGVNVYDGVRAHLVAEIQAGRKPVIAAFSDGARDRLASVLRDHGVAAVSEAADWAEIVAEKRPRSCWVATLGLERGFSADGLAVISEQDILGDRMVRGSTRRRRADNFLREASEIGEGDLVVHIEHGIGRYDGLKTVTAGGAPHDCLQIAYDGGDKLFVPVENIEVLSRYGSDEGGVTLDRLGGTNWQARKAKLRERIRDMAGKLIDVAAARQLRRAEALNTPEGVYDEFCAKFPFAETEDQARAIRDTLDDLTNGRPMDRLVCGDVGFGKTEVALRAAFAAVMAGRQVAVVCPTTLLCRQHYHTFAERFADLPVRVAQISRLVPAKQVAAIKDELARGQVDIIIGTHALLAKGVRFAHLGLLVIDEEQHFGVRHKERLKALKTDVHVLTLTATPIPRTLQLALSGVKELSVIATPPIDRLAVRSFITPYDAVVVREAILREHYRGGQSYYVCPRIVDLPKLAGALEKLVPEVSFAVAHGQMAAADLEKVMTNFYERKYDLLLATNIIESGIDVPSANTMIIHRADMFGLAQLYQLRGRIGRSKLRAYAYLTLPPGKKLTKAAERRLEVMQTLDSLGAGFNLASHDLDIRGAGNLLGEEQSGHIREVGIELYQHMLEEAVAEARGELLSETAADWAPQINIGMPVLIPDRYVPELGVRMSLYRRLSELRLAEDIDAFAAEMIDRFGKLPKEVENLIDVIAIKQMCRLANVEKVDAGPKGAVIAFRGNEFPNPAGLVGFIQRQVGTAKLRPDHRLVYMRNWEGPTDRLEGLKRLMAGLAEIAENGA